MPSFSFDGEFSGQNIFQTLSIARNVGSNIVNARIIIDVDSLSSQGDFIWFLSPDGGTTWESVAINQSHTFSTVGTDLRLKIFGNVGATITVRQSNGEDLPIKVIYNE